MRYAVYFTQGPKKSVKRAVFASSSNKPASKQAATKVERFNAQKGLAPNKRVRLRRVAVVL